MNKQVYTHLPDAEDFDERGEFYNFCNCGIKHTVLTQADNDPEYYTEVKLKCKCGRLVVFSLPVN